MSGQTFGVPIAKITKVDPETDIRFWNPALVGVKGPDEDFRKKLHEIDPDLRVTWSGFHERWIMWVKKPHLTSPISRGWSLLFVIKYPDGSYMPLDERTFAKVYSISAERYENAKEYYLAIEREWERDREKAKADRDSDVRHSAGEYFDYMKIKNYGKGSKFQEHFS